MSRHSPLHYAVAVGDHTSLTQILSSLPKLAHPTHLLTESDSLTHQLISDQISAALDRRDNPNHETALLLAVRLNDAAAVASLTAAGADISLQNSSGWNSLQEALIRQNQEIISILLQHQHFSAYSKWRRRLPRLVSALRRMRDFYMEISFRFESSIVPFVDKILPSDSYKIWKRDGKLRLDTTISGFDNLKAQRVNQSVLFFGDGNVENSIPEGSLLILNHDEKRVFDCFENAEAPLKDSEVSSFCKERSIYRPGMDVTKAKLVGRTNWRGQEKTETIGSWKSKVYEVQNVVFNFRSRKLSSGENSIPGSEQILPLELEEDSEDGFLVAEIPRFTVSESRNSNYVISRSRNIESHNSCNNSAFGERNRNRESRNSCNYDDRLGEILQLGVSGSRNSCNSDRFQRHRHSSFVREESHRELVPIPRNSVYMIPERRGRVAPRAAEIEVAPPPETKEKEYVKCLKPSIWLTEDFPLKTEELMPLLDILANKVKAVRRMRELLTTTFPPGKFPVKVAIPVVPTVRVVITFTKFVELQPIQQLPTPTHFSNGDDEMRETNFFSFSSSWMPGSGSRRGKQQPEQNGKGSNGMQQGVSDPFAIPAEYKWSSFNDKSKEMKKSKPTGRKIK